MATSLSSQSLILRLEKIFKPWKSLGFYSSNEPEVEELLDGSLFTHVSTLLSSSSRFWTSVIETEVWDEEPLLSLLYCYSLQQHNFFVFCNNLESRYRMFALILLRSKTLLLLGWRPRITCSFFAIPRSWPWKTPILQNLIIHRKLKSYN